LIKKSKDSNGASWHELSTVTQPVDIQEINLNGRNSLNNDIEAWNHPDESTDWH
jgi:hypothetical protein